ncbi:MAG TPA: hypothetical protein DDY32_02500 [Desulfobulbaceae bacterium]|nr:hypothetical protein [Desulfobulbaceae bacterium]
MHMQTKHVGIIWPGFRKYNEQFYRAVLEDQRFKTSVLWIRRFRHDEIPPKEVIESLSCKVVGAESIRISGYSVKTFLIMLYMIWKIVRECDGILTSTQAPLHSKVAFVLAKFYRKKIFVKTEQWRDLDNPSFFMRQYKKLDVSIIRNCDILLPHGTNQLQYAAGKGVNPGIMRVMPLLSDDLRRLPVDKPRLMENLGLQGKKVILYFGRLTRQKGLQDLLLACILAKKAMEKSVLLVCGGADRHFSDFSDTASYEDECRRLAEVLLPGKVIFTGPIASSDKHNYFQLADLFIHPHGKRGTDGWGLVINEAASMSLPIIVSDRVGCAPDLVVNGQNGYIVPAGDVRALAGRIEELMTDDGKRTRFAGQSRLVFERYHQPKKVPQVIWEALNGGEK